MATMNSKKLLLQIFMSLIFVFIYAVCYILIVDFTPSTLSVLGFSFSCLGIFWFLLFVMIYISEKKVKIWLLLPFLTFVSISIPFIKNEINLLDFILYIGIGIGINFLIAGINWRLFGLVIPGALILGIAPGLYFGWETTTAINPLEQTGIMLVGFAFGWGLITIASRALTKKFVWWPLIPGGILAVVGWGLYIAGNPESAIGFIGNTGSVGLIIFGIYILLMRRSFHQ